MYNQRNDDHGRRYNGRQGSGYENNRNDSKRDPYSGSWRTNEDRYEDDRYHTSRRQNEEDDYGPFSNIYNNDSERRGDFDTRYNHTGNYYYNNRGSGNDRSDEARGQSLSDVFGGGRRRSNSDREYFTSYRSGDDYPYGSDPHYSLYGSEDSARNNRSRYNDYDDRNFFERTGDRIRDTWNDWRDNNRRDDRDYHQEESRRNEDYRNMRDYSDRDKSYNGDSSAFNKRRRYNEGYLY